MYAPRQENDDFTDALEAFEVGQLTPEQCTAALQRAKRGLIRYEKSRAATLNGEDHSEVANKILTVLDEYLAWCEHHSPQLSHRTLGSELLEDAESLLRRSKAFPESVREADYQARLQTLLVGLGLEPLPSFGRYAHRSFGGNLRDQSNAVAEDAMREFVAHNWRKVVTDLYRRDWRERVAPFPDAVESLRRLLELKVRLAPHILAEISPPHLPVN